MLAGNGADPGGPMKPPWTFAPLAAACCAAIWSCAWKAWNMSCGGTGGMAMGPVAPGGTSPGGRNPVAPGGRPGIPIPSPPASRPGNGPAPAPPGPGGSSSRGDPPALPLATFFGSLNSALAPAPKPPEALRFFAAGPEARNAPPSQWGSGPSRGLPSMTLLASISRHRPAHGPSAAAASLGRARPMARPGSASARRAAPPAACGSAGTLAITVKMLTSFPALRGLVYAWLQRRGLCSFDGHRAQKNVGRSDWLWPCTATSWLQCRQ